MQKPHISFSELKDWNTCAFYHKLVHHDKLKGFRGNEYTAFGSAIHTVCEKKLLSEVAIPEEEWFIAEFERELKKLQEDSVPLNDKLVFDLRRQGAKILPFVQAALEEYFPDGYEVVSTEEQLMVPIEGSEKKFKGFIDAVFKTPDGKIHIVDWKSCSWGWDARKRTDPMVVYQLVFYKHFYALKHGLDPANIETHFALLKRTAKDNNVEFFRVTSGPKRVENAVKLLQKALYNITNNRYIKNKSSCSRCAFNNTEHCP
jgi:RecB family exonuclease